MTLLFPGVKVHLAFGYIDMRKGIDGLAMLVQGVLRQDPFSDHLFVFRGRKANLMQSAALGMRELPRRSEPCPGFSSSRGFRRFVQSLIRSPQELLFDGGPGPENCAAHNQRAPSDY